MSDALRGQRCFVHAPFVLHACFDEHCLAPVALKPAKNSLARTLPRRALCRVIEKLLLGNALALPALVRQFLHSSRASIEPLELEDPPNYRHRIVGEYRPDARRLNRTRASQHLSLARDKVVATDARRIEVLSHRCIHGVELLDRFGVSILLDARNEALQGLRRGHGGLASLVERKFEDDFALVDPSRVPEAGAQIELLRRAGSGHIRNE